MKKKIPSHPELKLLLRKNQKRKFHWDYAENSRHSNLRHLLPTKLQSNVRRKKLFEKKKKKRHWSFSDYFNRFLIRMSFLVIFKLLTNSGIRLHFTVSEIRRFVWFDRLLRLLSFRQSLCSLRNGFRSMQTRWARHFWLRFCFLYCGICSSSRVIICLLLFWNKTWHVFAMIWLIRKTWRRIGCFTIHVKMHKGRLGIVPLICNASAVCRKLSNWYCEMLTSPLAHWKHIFTNTQHDILQNEIPVHEVN